MQKYILFRQTKTIHWKSAKSSKQNGQNENDATLINFFQIRVTSKFDN
jgi:hypothetical protein